MPRQKVPSRNGVLPKISPMDRPEEEGDPRTENAARIPEARQTPVKADCEMINAHLSTCLHALGAPARLFRPLQVVFTSILRHNCNLCFSRQLLAEETYLVADPCCGVKVWPAMREFYSLNVVRFRLNSTMGSMRENMPSLAGALRKHARHNITLECRCVVVGKVSLLCNLAKSIPKSICGRSTSPTIRSRNYGIPPHKSHPRQPTARRTSLYAAVPLETGFRMRHPSKYFSSSSKSSSSPT